MNSVTFGPHIFTNRTAPGHPFSAKFRAVVIRNGEEHHSSGRIFRNGSGRLRQDIDEHGILAASILLKPGSDACTIINHISRAYLQSPPSGAEPLRCGIPGPEFGTRIIEGLACVRFPPNPNIVEAWLSPDLEFVVRELQRDSGEESAWELYDIVQAEPDPSLFEIPPGYQAGSGPEV